MWPITSPLLWEGGDQRQHCLMDRGVWRGDAPRPRGRCGTSAVLVQLMPRVGSSLGFPPGGPAEGPGREQAGRGTAGSGGCVGQRCGGQCTVHSAEPCAESSCWHSLQAEPAGPKLMTKAITVSAAPALPQRGPGAPAGQPCPPALGVLWGKPAPVNSSGRLAVSTGVCPQGGSEKHLGQFVPLR